MTEEYSPQKHEFGTDAAAEWAKSITPGQGKKEKKKMKEFFEYCDMLDDAVELKNPGLKDGQWYCGDADWFDYAVEVKNKEVKIASLVGHEAPREPHVSVAHTPLAVHPNGNDPPQAPI